MPFRMEKDSIRGVTLQTFIIICVLINIEAIILYTRLIEKMLRIYKLIIFFQIKRDREKLN